MRPALSRLAGAVLLALFTHSAHAAAPGKDGEFLDLLDQENKVFAASRYVQTLAETPASVSVISRDDIVRFGYRSIADALYSLPGFYNAASQWPALGMRGVAVPGDFNSRVLYMINGMPIYEPSYGGFFLEFLDIASIERIEVVRGSGSALYGNGAVMGIINLITRNGHDAPGKTAIASIGNDRSHSLYGSYAGVVGRDIDLFTAISVTGSAGRDLPLAEFGATSFGNDGQRTLRAFLRAADKDFWTQAVYVDGRKNDPLASYRTVFNSNLLLLRERFASIEVGGHKKLANGAMLTARAYAFDVAEFGDYPYRNDSARTGAADYINLTDIRSQTTGAELRYDHFIAERHHLLAGAEVKRVQGRHAIGDQPGLVRAGVIATEGKPSYGQYSLFVQDEWRLDEKRSIFLGARYDGYQGFSEGVKSHISPRIAYVQDFSGGNIGKLIFGEAYRAPTIYESLYTDLTPALTVTLWRNPTLKPEITRTLEAVWEHTARKGMNFSLNAYVTELRNTPRQVPVNNFQSIPCLVPDSCNQYQDSGSTMRVIGVEASGKWKRADGMIAYASATLQRGSEHPGDTPLASSPRYLLKGGISYPNLWQNWTASAEMHVVGSAYGRLNPNGTRTASVPAYALVNLGLANDRLGNGWSAALRINNLFDRRTYTVASSELQPVERVPAPGRMLWLQIRKDF